MAALALSDEHPPLAQTQIPKRRPITSQRRSAPKAMACTMARSRSVRSAPISAANSSGSKMRGRRRTSRTNGWPRNSLRSRDRRVGNPRGTGLRSTPTSPRVIR